MASNSEDEKKLKKAKKAAGKKRKAKELKRYGDNRYTPGSHVSDNQLFRGKGHMNACNFILCEFSCYSTRVSILVCCSLMSVYTESKV